VWDGKDLGLPAVQGYTVKNCWSEHFHSKLMLMKKKEEEKRNVLVQDFQNCEMLEFS
jgi:hypothetical protein